MTISPSAIARPASSLRTSPDMAFLLHSSHPWSRWPPSRSVFNATHPAQLLAGMNAALCGNTQGQFVTAAYAHLDAESRQLRYAAAGHPAMLLMRRGAVSEVAENGLILAAWASATYSEITLPLEPGDRLLLYTDGLIEARNAEGKLLGDEALVAEFSATAGLSLETAADRLIAAAQQWAQFQDDDLTVLVCDFLAAG